jgi:transcription elongation GreA/GreB family factor
MSRGFVKEDDLEHAGTDVPERTISASPNYVTTHGYAQLQKLAEDIEDEIKQLSAKKESTEVVQKLAVLNRDLRYIAARIESSQVVETKTGTTAAQVLFGTNVTVEDENGDLHAYAIVGEDEADIKSNKISWTSPLAKALIGQKIGDSVVWQRPIGNIVLEIISIQY